MIEVTSESTAAVDRGSKMRLYATVWRTPAYFIYDPETDKLDGYRLDVDRLQYAPLALDERGDFDVAPMKLKLGLRQTQYRDHERRFVRWLDPRGEPLPLPHELTLSALQSERRALTRAEEAQRRADEAQRKAEAERERADQAQAERDRALARMRELEAQLAKAKRE